MRRARLAAETLFIDVSDNVEADRILEAAIAAAEPGPERAEALSLRGLIRYYHGQTPDAVRLGEQAVAEAGADPDPARPSPGSGRVPRDAARSGPRQRDGHRGH